MQNFLWVSADGEGIETANGGSESMIVSELRGFSEPTAFNLITQQAVYQHGSTPTRSFARAREIRFKLHMFGSTLAEMETIRRFVGRSFSGIGQLEQVNEGVLTVTAEDAVDYKVSAVPSDVQWQTGTPGRGPLHQIANISLQACDPWWRVEPVNTQDIGIGSFSVSNDGDIPVFPTWYVNGPSTTPRLTLDDTGEYVEFDDVLASGWRLEVSHLFGRKYARAVEIANEDNIVNWMPFLTAASLWWKLAVGSNSVSFSDAYSDGAGEFSWYTLFQTVPI